MARESKSKGGRPPGKTLVRQLQEMVPNELDEKINEWRRKHRDLPSWSEAARRLIELGLKASQRGAK